MGTSASVSIPNCGTTFGFPTSSVSFTCPTTMGVASQCGPNNNAGAVLTTTVASGLEVTVITAGSFAGQAFHVDPADSTKLVNVTNLVITVTAATSTTNGVYTVDGAQFNGANNNVAAASGGGGGGDSQGSLLIIVIVVLAVVIVAVIAFVVLKKNGGSDTGGVRNTEAAAFDNPLVRSHRASPFTNA